MNSFLKGMENNININYLVSIFNSLDDMVFLVEFGTDGLFRNVEVNPAFLKVTGMELQNLKNKPLEEAFEPKEVVKMVQNYKKAIQKKQALSYEEMVTIGGQLRTFETTIIPIFQDGTYILGITRDISQRKKHEEALIEAKQELKKLVQYQQGVILKAEKRGDDFFYTLCDGQLLDRLNITPEKIINNRPQDFFSEEIASNINKYYQRCWETKEKVIYESFAQLNTGTLNWLTVVSPFIENGKTTSLIIYGIDISERKKAEESLMKAEKLALIGELAAGIGHEIRNPLTSIRGFIKLMRQCKETLKDEFLDVIDAELESLNHIAGELMMLAKPQAIENKNINIIEILNEVIFLLEPEAFRNGVEIIKLYKRKNATIFGDKQQIKQVIINLIKNAIEALERQSNGRIVVECKIEGTEVLIRISDNGCGIPKELLQKIGEPFYTTKEKGTGLGLMVSYRIIKNHDGSILCESEEGKGTSFVLTFPSYRH